MRQVLDQRLVLDCIGFDTEGRGELAVRFAKATFDETGKMVDRGKPHRFVLQPGDDVDAALAAIDQHISSMGFDGPCVADVIKLKAIARACWTPDTLAQSQAAWIEWERANEEDCRRRGVPALTMQQGVTVDFAQRLSAAVKEWRADDLGRLN